MLLLWVLSQDLLLDLLEKSLFGLVTQIEFLSKSLDDLVWLIVFVYLNFFNMLTVKLNLENTDRLLDLRCFEMVRLRLSLILLLIEHAWCLNLAKWAVHFTFVRIVASTTTGWASIVQEGAWLDLWSLVVWVALVVAILSLSCLFDRRKSMEWVLSDLFGATSASCSTSSASGSAWYHSGVGARSIALPWSSLAARYLFLVEGGSLRYRLVGVVFLFILLPSHSLSIEDILSG